MRVYNKLFTKILDSSVWLESTTTRLVWLTLIASMDETGFCAFAAMGNLANRARVPLSACEAAVKVLESADSESADPDNNGRRIERVPGGWLVLNATKYRDMVTRVIAQERTRERVRRHRAEKAGNAPVTVSNDPVTQSEAVALALATTKPSRASRSCDGFDAFWLSYPRKVSKPTALKAWSKLSPDADLQADIIGALEFQSQSEQWRRDDGRFIPHPATWLNGRRWEDVTPDLERKVKREKFRDWREECHRVHGGSCGDSVNLHIGKMDEGR